MSADPYGSPNLRLNLSLLNFLSLLATMIFEVAIKKWQNFSENRRKHYVYSYVFASFVSSLPYASFSTYVRFQLQQIGFVIGHGVSSSVCETSCIVPFGSSELDLNAVLLYLNAMGFAIAGFVIIFIAALGDYSSKLSAPKNEP